MITRWPDALLRSVFTGIVVLIARSVKLLPAAPFELFDKVTFVFCHDEGGGIIPSSLTDFAKFNCHGRYMLLKQINVICYSNPTAMDYTQLGLASKKADINSHSVSLQGKRKEPMHSPSLVTSC